MPAFASGSQNLLTPRGWDAADAARPDGGGESLKKRLRCIAAERPVLSLIHIYRRRISGLREVDRDTGLSQLGVNEKALEQHLRGIPAKEACSHNFKRLFRVS